MTYLVGMMSRIRSGTGLLLTNVVPTRFLARIRTARKVAGQIPGEVWRMLLVLFAVLLVWHELATSALQAHLLAGYASRLSWQVAPGPSTSIVFPRGGPFDERRGYSALPRFTHRLERRGYRLMEQSRFSPDLEWLAGLGVPPPDAEPPAAGLIIVGSDGDTLFDALPRGDVIEHYEELPPVVVNSLLYLENRQLGDPPDPRANPVVDWRRLTKAGLLYAGHGIGLPLRIQGGSTLAIQLEKFRHSSDGLTESPSDKLRQIVSASLRAYREGPNTHDARRRIVLDYLNTMPLAAATGYGEVNGLADGLQVWFGRTPKRTFRALNQPEVDPGVKARAFRHVLALLYAVRAPTSYLVRDHEALEERTSRAARMLAAAGVIDSTFADAVCHERLSFSPGLERRDSMTAIAAKAPNLVREQLQSILDVPDFYSLNRLDLDAQSTIDVGLQREATALFGRMLDSSFVVAHGLRGEHLLSSGDPGRVVYSLELFESTPRGNELRVHADNLDRPFDVNRDMKMELGSTAKLRTLAHYLEVMTSLHAGLSGLDADSLAVLSRGARDPLTRWAADTLRDDPGLSLDGLLAGSLERAYSANPGETFFTGGGMHVFHNFDPNDNRRRLTIREAAAHSTNLVFVRLMRDIERYHQERLPYDARAVLSGADAARRRDMLARAAEAESRQILYRAWRRYRNRSTRDVERTLLGSGADSPRPLAVLWHAWKPRAAPDSLPIWLHQRVPGLKPRDLKRVAKAYDNPRLTLLDYAFLLDRHPLDVWCAGVLARHPRETWDQLYANSVKVRVLTSAWLFDPRHQHAQDLRLRIRIEQDAFADMLPSWKALGFPFDHLVPSYATAIGSSSDRPNALAALMGIIVNDGMLRPNSSLQRLAFGPNTPYQTTFEAPGGADRRVMAEPVAKALRSVLAGVVDHGTAERIKSVFVGTDSLPLAVGGKTGSGDNRFLTFGRGGRTISSRAISRTAAFVFYIGPRHFGIITASVTGPSSGQYRFTSALPLAVLRLLAPAIQRELTPPPDPTATAATVGVNAPRSN